MQDDLSLDEVKTIAQLRSVIAEEVEAKANIAQAQALVEQMKWTKYMTLGTFFMAVATAAMAVVTYLK